ncbi:hypothetical protein [Halolamina salifodinae]|uniref:Uncharacterized protein n=1 Tax=Halolamina salifodinae TaxID=1202767 RepID=A0A8T4H0C1_9EURY|nr:hypothetical protein [Halolamina salifodinae]MBP1988130.1 hypothetical protein [Halolamina salifodinae]
MTPEPDPLELLLGGVDGLPSRAALPAHAQRPNQPRQRERLNQQSREREASTATASGGGANPSPLRRRHQKSKISDWQTRAPLSSTTWREG